MLNSDSVLTEELCEPSNSNQQPVWLEGFVSVYKQLSTDNLHLLANVYDEDVVFIDPMHQIEGFDALSRYFESLYSNLSSCAFNITHFFVAEQQAAVYWQMTFSHRKLNKGKPVTVEGHSHIKGANGRVIYHRDYLDVGAMFYEHVPIVGSLVRLLKKRATG